MTKNEDYGIYTHACRVFEVGTTTDSLLDLQSLQVVALKFLALPLTFVPAMMFGGVALLG